MSLLCIAKSLINWLIIIGAATKKRKQKNEMQLNCFQKKIMQ